MGWRRGQSKGGEASGYSSNLSRETDHPRRSLSIVQPSRGATLFPARMVLQASLYLALNHPRYAVPSFPGVGFFSDYFVHLLVFISGGSIAGSDRMIRFQLHG